MGLRRSANLLTLVMKLLAGLLAAGVVAVAVWLLVGSSEPRALDFAVVTRDAVTDALVTNGRIEAGRRFDVFAETAGRVAELYVELGDRVRRGQRLARVADVSAGASLEQAEAQLEAARAELAAAERPLPAVERADLESRLASLQRQRQVLEQDLARVERLIERAAAPRIERDEIQDRLTEMRNEIDLIERKLALEAPPERLRGAQARVEEAEAAISLARRQVNAATVTAPVEGSVYSLPVRVGAYVRPGEMIARISGEDRPVIVIYVDEPELGRVELGDTAAVTADAYPGQSWRCVVDRLPSEVVEIGSRRVGEVRCRLTEEADRLIPNLTVNISIETASAKGVLTLPREAVIAEAGKAYVWVRDESGAVQRRDIRTGVRGPDRVEVLSGLEEGQRALIPGATPLEPGQPVELRE